MVLRSVACPAVYAIESANIETGLSFCTETMHAGQLPKGAFVDRVDWSAVRGANYFPSYARDQMEAWLTCFNREIVAREIGFAGRLGFDSLRIWPCFDAYLQAPRRFLDNLRYFLDTCRQSGLKAIVNVFDGGGTERSGSIAENVPLGEALDRTMIKDRSGEQMTADQRRVLDALAGPAFLGDIEVAYAGDPKGIFFNRWWQSPGISRLGEDWRPRIETYLRALIGNLGQHPAVLAWDVMNEPKLVNALRKERTEIDPFLKWACRLLAKLRPRAPLTIGCIWPAEMEEYDDLTDGVLGLLSCHSYERGEELSRSLEDARKVAERLGKPWLLTEWGNFAFPPDPGVETDEAQDAIYADALPRLAKAKAGWLCYQLIMGYTIGTWLALLRPDGTRRTAAHRVAAWLSEHDGRMVRVRSAAPSFKGRTTIAQPPADNGDPDGAQRHPHGPQGRQKESGKTERRK
jgi:hypothetical protein